MLRNGLQFTIVPLQDGPTTARKSSGLSNTLRPYAGI